MNHGNARCNSESNSVYSFTCPQKMKSENLSGFLTFDIEEFCCSLLTPDIVTNNYKRLCVYVDRDVKPFLSAP
jgi:hypothetical protein